MIRRAIKIVINRNLISPLQRCDVAKFLARLSCRRHFWQLAACLMDAARLMDGKKRKNLTDTMSSLALEYRGIFISRSPPSFSLINSPAVARLEPFICSNVFDGGAVKFVLIHE